MDKDWIFFDIGSTIADETLCYEKIIKDNIKKLKGIGIESSIEDHETALKNSYIEMNLNPIEAALKCFYPKIDYTWDSSREILFPEVNDILDNLHTRYKLGIIANQKKGLRTRLENHQISQHFDLVVSSSDVGIKKPSPEIFEKALFEADCEADRAVYVGDRVDNDVVPSKKIGMTSIRVMKGWGKYQTEIVGFESDYTINNFQELLKIL